MSCGEPWSDDGLGDSISWPRSAQVFQHYSNGAHTHAGKDLKPDLHRVPETLGSKLAPTECSVAFIDSSFSPQRFSRRTSGAAYLEFCSTASTSSDNALSVDDSDTFFLSEAATPQDTYCPPTCAYPSCSDSSSCPADSVQSSIHWCTRSRTKNLPLLPLRCSVTRASQELDLGVGTADITSSGQSGVVQGINVANPGPSAKSGRDTFPCVQCGKVFATRSTLRHHVISHDPIKAHKYHCTTCQRGFRYPKDLKRHSVVHRQVHKDGSLSDDLACPLCYKTFSRRDNFRRHQRSSCRPPSSAAKNTSGTCDLPTRPLQAKKTATGLLEAPANDYDHAGEKNQDCSRSNGKTTQSSSQSHLTVPLRSGPGQPSTKRPRKSNSNEKDGSDEDKRPRKRQSSERSSPPKELLPCPSPGCKARVVLKTISAVIRHLESHSVDICPNCLELIMRHPHGIPECVPICAWLRCPNRPPNCVDAYHIRGPNCKEKRENDFTKNKYQLLCRRMVPAPEESTNHPEQLFLDFLARDETQRETIAAYEQVTATYLETINALLQDPQPEHSRSDGAMPALGPSQVAEGIGLGRHANAFISPNDIATTASFQMLPTWQSTSQGTDMHHVDPQDQGARVPMSTLQPFIATAISGGPYPTTEQGSFTQPSYQLTYQTYSSQYDTQTEASAAPREGSSIVDTPKPPDWKDLIDFSSFELNHDDGEHDWLSPPST